MGREYFGPVRESTVKEMVTQIKTGSFPTKGKVVISEAGHIEFVIEPENCSQEQNSLIAGVLAILPLKLKNLEDIASGSNKLVLGTN